MYVLEVVKYEENNDPIHVGYMQIIFNNIKEARDYYNENNQHMRQLKKYNDFMSDCDPDTNLAYIIRNDYGLVLDIESW